MNHQWQGLLDLLHTLGWKLLADLGQQFPEVGGGKDTSPKTKQMIGELTFLGGFTSQSLHSLTKKAQLVELLEEIMLIFFKDHLQPFGQLVGWIWSTDVNW